MDHKEFSWMREKLDKTQKELAELLGGSIKSVQSFEQGWRKVPVHVERQMLFLLFLKREAEEESRPCWEIRDCLPELRRACPAWEFRAGRFCWFINGTICRGKKHSNWGQKMKVCRRCEVFAAALKL